MRARLEQVDGAADGVRVLVVHVELHAAQHVARVVDAVARQPLEDVHDDFAVAPRIHEERVEPALVRRDTQPQEVAVDSLELGDQHADGLRARRRLHAGQRLDAEGVGGGVDVRADPADPLEHVHRLRPVVLLDALFDAAVDVAEAGGGGGDDLAVDGDLEMTGLLQRGVLRPDRDDELLRSGFDCGFHRVPLRPWRQDS